MDAFNKYNFGDDENWKAYIRTVELASGDSEEAMRRVKARWYKKNIDPSFDASLLGSANRATQGARAFGAASGAGDSNASSAASRAGGGGRGTWGSGYDPRSPPPPPRYGAAGSGTYGDLRSQTRLFFMHVGMLLLGVFSLVPFLPYSRTAYVNLMRLTIVTLGYKIYLQHGLPQIRPLNMLMAWVQRVMPTADFLQLLTAFSFSAQPPLALVAAPLAVLAAYHVGAFAAAHCYGHPLWRRFGSRLHAVMLRKQSDALLLNAWCEVGTVAVLVLQLLTPARSLITLLFYSQILKLKLHVPDSAPHHRQVWRKVDEVTLPYRLRAPPAVERVIQLAVNWFMSVPGAH